MATIISDSPSGWSRIVLGQVCIRWVVATTASITKRQGILLPARIIVLWSPASKSSYRWKGGLPLASWPSAGSILVSSWRKRKALCHGSNSALTTEMFWGWFSSLSILKLILFQSKSSNNIAISELCKFLDCIEHTHGIFWLMYLPFASVTENECPTPPPTTPASELCAFFY